MSDPFRDFDTEFTVRKAVEGQGSMQNVPPSTVAAAVAVALAKQLEPITDGLAALNRRLDGVEDAREGR